MRQVVAYKRLKTIEFFFFLIFSEVVAVALERWSFTKGFIYSNVIKKHFAVVDRWSRITRGGRLGRFDCM